MTLCLFGPNGRIVLGSSQSAVRINRCDEGLHISSGDRKLLLIEDTDASGCSTSCSRTSHPPPNNGSTVGGRGNDSTINIDCGGGGTPSGDGSGSSGGCDGSDTVHSCFTVPNGDVFTIASDTVFKEDVFVDGELTTCGNVICHATVQCVDIEQTSDERLKKDIYPLKNALRDICSIVPVKYKYKSGSQQLRLGVLAQNVQEIFPEAVNASDANILFVRYNELIAPLIGAVQELNEQNSELRKRLRHIESK